MLGFPLLDGNAGGVCRPLRFRGRMRGQGGELIEQSLYVAVGKMPRGGENYVAGDIDAAFEG